MSYLTIKWKYVTHLCIFKHLIQDGFLCFCRTPASVLLIFVFFVSPMFLMPLLDLAIQLEFMLVLQSASATWKICCCMCLFLLLVCFGVVCLCEVLQATTMHACTKWHYTTQVVHSVAVSDAWIMTSTHVKTHLHIYLWTHYTYYAS